MSYYFITASKDATIYLQQPNQNTGRDEILEVSKIYYGNILDISRVLVQFDVSVVSASISNGSIGFDECSLLMYESDSEELPFNFTINCHAVSQSWDNGLGTRFDEISNQGVTWNYREGESKQLWLDSTVFYNDATGSYAGLGGVFLSDPTVNQVYEYGVVNLNMDVKPIVKEWLSGSIENNGFIIKHTFSSESDVKDYGVLKFFSKETNTIYQPKLRLGWDDHVFLTGSRTIIGTEDMRVSLTNLKSTYRNGSNVKIRLYVNELYPIKTFANAFSQTTGGLLPENSYYQIIDFGSKSTIIPYSEYSKISCDANGNYFSLYFDNWESGRFYEIELKTSIDGSDVYIRNPEFKFKLID